MKKLHLPLIGLRNIKTSLSVFICLLVLSSQPFSACIAAIICMQDTVENSVKTGSNRLIGTLMGGIVGVLILFVFKKFNILYCSPLIIALGVSFIIYLCNLIKVPGASSIASIVLISILIAPPIYNPLILAGKTTLETAFGIIIAILVNKYINPPFQDKSNLNKSTLD